MIKTLLKINDIITGVEARKDEEHKEFLVFFETLVRGVTPAASKSFGNLSVALEGGKNAGIELTATDFGWWTVHIENGARFLNGTHQVKSEIYNRMSKKAEAFTMTKEERGAFIDLVKSEASK